MKIICVLLVVPCLLVLARAREEDAAGDGKSFVQVGDVVRTRKLKSEAAPMHPGLAEDFVVRTKKVQAPEEIKDAAKELEKLLKPTTPETPAEPVNVVRKAQKAPEARSFVQQEATGFRRLPRLASSEQELPSSGMKLGIIGEKIREIFAAGEVQGDDIPTSNQVVRSRKARQATPEQTEEVLPKERPVGAISLVEMRHDGELKEVPEAPLAAAEEDMDAPAAKYTVVRNRPKRSGVSSQQPQHRMITEEPAETPAVDVVRTRARK